MTRCRKNRCCQILAGLALAACLFNRQALSADRSPYVAFDGVFKGSVESLVDLMPAKTYRFEAKRIAEAHIDFTDADGRRLDSRPLASGDEFSVPVLTMKSRLVVDASPNLDASVSLRQVADAPGDFDWHDWNAWNMVADFKGEAVFRRRFSLKELPIYAFVRVFKASLAVNGRDIGESRGTYVNDNFFDISKSLKKGENEITLSPIPRAKPDAQATLTVEVAMRYADGRDEVMLGSDGLWEARPAKGEAWSPVTAFRASWYNQDLFDKPWVAPAEMPPSALPFRAAVTAEATLFQSTCAVGETLSGRLSVAFGQMPYFTANRIKLAWIGSDGKEAWRQWLFPDADLRNVRKGDRVDVPFSLDTRYLEPGEYALRLDERLDTGRGNVLAKVKLADGAVRKPPEVEIVLDRAADLVRIDGEEIPIAIVRQSTHYSPFVPRGAEDIFHSFMESGYRIYSLPCSFGFDAVKASGAVDDATVWKGPGEYDFRPLDEAARQILSVDPDAWLVPVIAANAPGWWTVSHPEDLVVLDDGTPHKIISYASAAWRRDVEAAIRASADYMRRSAWGSRIAMWYMAAGYDGQWFQPTEYKPPYRLCDYSTAQRDHFRRWLQREYKTPSALSAAWGRTVTRFDDVEIPSKAERTEGKPYYLDPTKDRPSIDFLRSVATLTDEVISGFMGAFEAGFGRRIPGGTYYIPGDCTYNRGQVQRPCDEGIFGCAQYMYAASPLGYDCHGLEQEGTGLTRPGNAMRLLGRLYVGEDDTRTFRSQPHNPRWGNATSFGTLAGFRRNIAQRTTVGGAHWMLDMYGFWYDSPSIQSELRRGLELMRRLGKLPRLSELSAQVANVAKTGVNLNKRINTPDDLHQVHFPTKNLRKPNFAVDRLFWRNLEAASPEALGYKMYVFDDVYALDDDERATIDRLKGGGRVLVFTHASGYSDGRKLSAGNVSRVVGIEVEDDKAVQAYSPMLWTWTKDGKIEAKAPKAKRFNVVDRDAVVLGRYADGKVAAAMKRHDGWTAVYLPAAFPQGEILDRVGTLAGVHVYTDLPVVVGAGGRCVSVYCPVRSAKGTIRLPGRFTVTEAYSGRTYENALELPVDMSLGETRLFVVDTAWPSR